MQDDMSLRVFVDDLCEGSKLDDALASWNWRIWWCVRTEVTFLVFMNFREVLSADLVLFMINDLAWSFRQGLLIVKQSGTFLAFMETCSTCIVCWGWVYFESAKEYWDTFYLLSSFRRGSSALAMSWSIILPWNYTRAHYSSL